MEKSKAQHMLSETGVVDVLAWVTHFSEKHSQHDIEKIKKAVNFARLHGEKVLTESQDACLHQGLSMAEILAELNVDVDTLCAGMVYPSVRYAKPSLHEVEEALGTKVKKLLEGAAKMESAQELHHASGSKKNLRHTTIDNFRKMFLAMVDDVRVVLIKLAEFVCVLQVAKYLDEDLRRKFAKQGREIYAPLANRLGIGHLKWLIEDFSFRYLEPELYKEISSSLSERRTDRDSYVKKMISLLQDIAKSADIKNVKINGRAKHIYSIYRKMQRKNLPIEEIYDITAVRALVPTVEDCYALLSGVHACWEPIKKEFDDYISRPKSNGYRSIHTAVVGPDNKKVEIQIRTFDMHDEAELGVAAHWAYKEGSGKEKYHDKIAWLRQVMDWQEEVAETKERGKTLQTQIFSDRVYAFTPNHDVFDLVAGATVLDFAFLVHSDIGLRCRGAKVNGKIVPLTYPLAMGDCVEILTYKEPKPGRDWLSEKYLKTTRARTKLRAYFHKVDVQEGRVTEEEHPVKKQEPIAIPKPKKEKDAPKIATVDDVVIEGVGKLLTSMAKCCQPKSTDAIIGYITQSRGVTVHRKNCGNVSRLGERYKDRLIDVIWKRSKHRKHK